MRYSSNIKDHWNFPWLKQLNYVTFSLDFDESWNCLLFISRGVFTDFSHVFTLFSPFIFLSSVFCSDFFYLSLLPFCFILNAPRFYVLPFLPLPLPPLFHPLPAFFSLYIQFIFTFFSYFVLFQLFCHPSISFLALLSFPSLHFFPLSLFLPFPSSSISFSSPPMPTSSGLLQRTRKKTCGISKKD